MTDYEKLKRRDQRVRREIAKIIADAKARRKSKLRGFAEWCFKTCVKCIPIKK